MNIESEYKCLKIEHEGQKIEGFCLNLNCQTKNSQFCFKCNGDPKFHTNCKNDLMKFESINQFISEFNKDLADLRKQLKESQEFLMRNYIQFEKKLEEIYKQFIQISQYCDQQKYHEIKLNIYSIKEAYDFKNNQEENIKQNQIGVKLNEVNKLIKAYQLYQAESQNNETVLDDAICLLNQSKWQKANDLISKHLLKLDKHISFAKFFQSIALIELNKPGEGMNIRDQAKKMNNELYSELLNYAEQELPRNPNNTFMLITKSYALNDQLKYQEAIKQCEKVLIMNPSHLHALYRKSYALQDLEEYQQAHSCIDDALQYNNKYSIALFQKGYTLQLEGKYHDAISAYTQTLEVDKNFGQAYNNKGNSLNRTLKHDDAIECFDQAIFIDPYNATAYSNKGQSLESLKKYDQALINYSNAISIDRTYANAYKQKGKLLKAMKNYKQAVETYTQATKFCKQNENEFQKLISSVINCA